MPEQLTEEEIAIIKELSGMPDLSAEEQAILNELKTMIPSEAGPVPLERKEPEYYQQRAAEFRAEKPGVGTFTQQLAAGSRPYLQAAGATAGGIIGGASGLLTGPGAVGASPIGALAGGGLGFAMGDEIADMLEQWAGSKEPKPLMVELTEAGKNIVEGAAYEAGGQAIGPALSVAGKAAMKVPAIEYSVLAGKELLGQVPAMTKEGIKKAAGKYLYANTSKGPIIAKNIETAKAIEDQIPNLKFTYGEMTGDPNIIKLEKAAMGEPTQFAQDLIEQQKFNDEAIQKSIMERRPKGDIGDVVEAFEGQKANLAAGEKTAQTVLEKETEKLGMGAGQLEAGQTIRAEAKSGKEVTKTAGKKLYQEIPQYDWKTIDASQLIDDADALTQPMNQFENVEKNVPWTQINKVKEVLAAENNIVSLKDLDGLQSELKSEIRRMRSPQASGGEINERKISRLVQLNNKVENLIKSISEGGGPSAPELKKARTFWKQEVIDKFKKGDVGEILANKGGGEYKVNDAQIASKFWKPGQAGQQAAKQFKSAIGGSQKAMQAIEDAAKQDLLSKFPGEEITEGGLRRWLNRHKLALEEYGLTDKFNSIKKAREQLTDAITFRKDFEKSEAAKLIGADPDIAIKRALGAVNTGKAAAELMKATKGNKTAQAGLRNSLQDFILEQSKNLETGMITKIDTLDKLSKKYRPAMNVFYNENKDALRAWDTARQAFRIAQKSSRIPGFKGSETQPLLLTSFFKAAGLTEGKALSLLKAIMSPLKQNEIKKMNLLVNQALLNPDFAYTLMLAADTAKPGIMKGTLPKYHLAGRGKYVKEGILPEYLRRRISQHLATITGASSRPMKIEEPQQ